jgi:hypothetical protein
VGVSVDITTCAATSSFRGGAGENTPTICAHPLTTNTPATTNTPHLNIVATLTTPRRASLHIFNP